MAVKPAEIAMKRTEIVIVGCGPGSPEYLTAAARQAASRAGVLVGSPRLLALFAEHGGRKIALGRGTDAALGQIAAARRAGQSVAVLVSGDPGLFSLARHVLAQFGREQCVVVPGISSVQVALGRLGLDWADARLVSAHGRPPDVEPEQLASADKVAILAGGRRGREWSARAAAALQASHVAYLCENLTLKDERVRPVAPHEIQQAASLSIILLVRRSLVP